MLNGLLQILDRDPRHAFDLLVGEDPLSESDFERLCGLVAGARLSREERQMLRDAIRRRQDEFDVERWRIRTGSWK